ncbi:MAG: alternative ribosome rescue aminoacyl-tRNA hydrolase ArfB [Parvibaculum sp.]
MAKIQITDKIEIDEVELVESFIQAGGPGGQNVNKVATAVQLKFDLRNTQALTPSQKARLKGLVGRRLSASGILTITAREFRTQNLNRAAARERLFNFIKEAAVPPRFRVKTRPSKTQKTKRLDEKGKRGSTKAMRRRPPPE